MTEVYVILGSLVLLISFLLFYISKKNARIKELVKKVELFEQAFSIEKEKIVTELAEYKANKLQEIKKEVELSEKGLAAIKENVDNKSKELDLKYKALNELLRAQYTREEELLKNSLATQQESLKQLEETQRLSLQQRQLEEKELNEKLFYTVNIDQSLIGDIKDLTDIAVRYSRIALPLQKAIWEVYYRTPVNDMVRRIVQGRKICGIYKITNIFNGKCYVGQSVDIGARWVTHIKRAIGVEETTSNKLYPIMRSVGVHNFLFTIIEEVEASKLRERELYWQKHFAAVEDGYSIK